MPVFPWKYQGKPCNQKKMFQLKIPASNFEFLIFNF